MKHRNEKHVGVGEAAQALAVCTETVRRYVNEGTLPATRTKGGQLRIPWTAVENFRAGHSVGPSLALQNRRSHVAELTVQAEEIHAKRNLHQLQAEDAMDRQREREARADAAADRRNETERLRLEREQREREGGIKADRSAWIELTLLRIPAGLPPERRQAVLEAIGRMPGEIVSDPELAEPFISNLLCQQIRVWEIETRAHASRAKVAEEIIRRNLPFPLVWDDSAKARADELIRQKFNQLPLDTSRSGLIVAAEEALQPLVQQFHSQEARKAALVWAIRELPSSASDLDRAGLQKRAREILAATLSDDELDLRAALHPLVSEVATPLRAREERKQRERRTQELISRIPSEIQDYLRKLVHDDELSFEDLSDQEWRSELVEAVQEGLELTGDESAGEFSGLVRELVDDELE